MYTLTHAFTEPANAVMMMTANKSNISLFTAFQMEEKITYLNQHIIFPLK